MGCCLLLLGERERVADKFPRQGARGNSVDEGNHSSADGHVIAGHFLHPAGGSLWEVMGVLL